MSGGRLPTISSPAWRAGLREGDRLDLGQMRCFPVDTLRCATALAALGGAALVGDRRDGEVWLTAAGDKPPRKSRSSLKRRRSAGGTRRFYPRSDSRFACHSRRRLARLDSSGRNDLGIFPLRPVVQSRPVLRILRIFAVFSQALLTQNLAGYVAQGAGLAGFLLSRSGRAETSARHDGDRSSGRGRPSAPCSSFFSR